MNSYVDDGKGGGAGARLFYPVRDSDNPQKVTLFPISEELYHELYPSIWRTQKRMQRLGRCACPRSKLWSCDADCPVCRYRSEGNQVSIDTTINSAEDLTLGDTLMDDAPLPESIAFDHALLEMLYQELDELDPEGRRICELLMNHSEREAAALLKMARSTFTRHWEMVKNRLRNRLKDFIE